jgi:hypothetical protein
MAPLKQGMCQGICAANSRNGAMSVSARPPIAAECHRPWWPSASGCTRRNAGKRLCSPYDHYLRVSTGAWQLLARVRSRSISAPSMDATPEKVLGEHRHLRMMCFGRSASMHALADRCTCLAVGLAPAETLESGLATASATVNASSTNTAFAALAM